MEFLFTGLQQLNIWEGEGRGRRVLVSTSKAIYMAVGQNVEIMAYLPQDVLIVSRRSAYFQADKSCFLSFLDGRFL